MAIDDTAQRFASQGGWMDSRAFRGLLVGACTVGFLLVWLVLPEQGLRQSASWFPVSLHATSEAFAIVVSAMVFSVSWHSHRPERPGNLIVLACAFLAVALLDFAHMMSYRGMPEMVTPAAPQKAISFWLSARIVGALAVLWIVFRPWAPFRRAGTRYAWLAGALAYVAAVAWLQLAHPGWWPTFFVPGQGLTPLKVLLEAMVVLMMALAMLRLLHVRELYPTFDTHGLAAASALWILSELCLTMYENVNDLFSLVGHVYKVLAYLLVYRVVFVASVREPYERLAVETARSRAAEQQVEALAFYDRTTGLPNRALLRDRTTQVLAARHEDHGHAALLLLNIDGFKHINDSLGHAAGDTLLRELARRLPAQVGDSDTVSCLGGDEFAVLLREVRDAGSVAAAQERILAALAEPVPVAGRELRITVSMGAALSPGDGHDFDTLLQNAGTAQHRAKEAGGSGWRFYDATMNEEVSERLALRNGLRQALERGEFVLHYQPQFSLDDGALVGVEALVRWRHPEQGMVPPMRFIPEAEDSGLIVPIGLWILREACRQAAAWRADGLDVPRVAVNLSAKQFQRGDVAADVLEALSATGLAPGTLELELTESILLKGADTVLATVRKLRGLGVHLSIDDFGTGYSSLAYLQHFPVDKLKIDQSFVRRLGEGGDAQVIVTTIIQLARSLGLGTIAEGVEDAATAARLLALGCQQGQGFHFARPMPPGELAVLLAGRQRAEAEIRPS
ncbi:MAG: EAL domain-containing protein [Rhizobium sp.]|nr:EAL domain-containing protein [Rhizobium sp.]